MWVVKVKREKGNRKVYRRVWKLSPKIKRDFWEFACYTILAVMMFVWAWYEL